MERERERQRENDWTILPHGALLCIFSSHFVSLRNSEFCEKPSKSLWCLDHNKRRWNVDAADVVVVVASVVVVVAVVAAASLLIVVYCSFLIFSIFPFSVQVSGFNDLSVISPSLLLIARFSAWWQKSCLSSTKSHFAKNSNYFCFPLLFGCITIGIFTWNRHQLDTIPN